MEGKAMSMSKRRVLKWLRGLSGEEFEEAANSGKLSRMVAPLVYMEKKRLGLLDTKPELDRVPEERRAQRLTAKEWARRGNENLK